MSKVTDSCKKKFFRSFRRSLNKKDYTELRDRVVTGTPSSTFQILAEPSVEVEARNSESRLKYDKTKDNTVSINVIKVSQD